LSVPPGTPCILACHILGPVTCFGEIVDFYCVLLRVNNLFGDGNP
jgi:hypothetical protein